MSGRYRLEVAVEMAADAGGGLGWPMQTCSIVSESNRPERRPAREQTIKERAQAIDVGRRGDTTLVSHRLLWGHVTGRAHDQPRLGCISRSAEPLGQAEVGDVSTPFVVDQDIRGLQIAMQHTSLVCMVDRSRDRGDQASSRPGVTREIVQALFEASPAISFIA